MLEYLIIGGGIHGSYLAKSILLSEKISRNKLRIIDPHEGLMSEWRRKTRNCGMTYLRSPAGHNLDGSVGALIQYARERGRDSEFIDDAMRPSLKLFNDHCTDMVSYLGLQNLTVGGYVTGVRRYRNGLMVDTTSGSLSTKTIILATGENGGIKIPDWIRRDYDGSRVQHIFDAGFDMQRTLVPGHTLVVGAGITAGQVALAISKHKPGYVTLLTRSDIRMNQLDASPKWTDLPYIKDTLHSLKDNSTRNAIILRERNYGTMPSEIFVGLLFASLEGRINHVVSPVLDVKPKRSGVVVKTNSGRQKFSSIVLATGYELRNNNSLVESMSETLDLPLTLTRHPSLKDGSLLWSNNQDKNYSIFVSGHSAELVLGPFAKNIQGVKLAWKLMRRKI